MRPPPCLASHLGGATVSSDQVTFILINIINLTFLILIVINMLNDGISTHWFRSQLSELECQVENSNQRSPLLQVKLSLSPSFSYQNSFIWSSYTSISHLHMFTFTFSVIDCHGDNPRWWSTTAKVLPPGAPPHAPARFTILPESKAQYHLHIQVRLLPIKHHSF